MARTLLAPLTALALAGCVGVPFATPPGQITVGAAGRSMARTHREVIDVPFQLRAAVHPLGFTPQLLDRPADFGVGYLLDFNKLATIQGAYLEAGAVLAQGDLDGRVGRVMARVQPRLLFEPGVTLGHGAALQLTAEWAGFGEGPFEGSDYEGGAFGYAFGENSVGAYLEGAYQKLGTDVGWTVGGGLLFRLPAMAGIAWAWIWALD